MVTPPTPLTGISGAADISADGTVVVGYDGSEAFRYFIAMESIAELLTAQGVDITGWTISSATGVSADGSTIVGIGRNPSGDSEAWIATLPLP